MLDPCKSCEDEGAVECTTCRLCKAQCPVELSLDSIMPVRRYMLQPKGSHRGAFQTIGRATAFSNISEWLKDVETDENSDIAYFPGCAVLNDIYLRRDTNYSGASQAGVKVLNALGIKPRIIYGCCGHDIYYSGSLDEFEALKDNLKEKLTGKIIVGCAECYHMLKDFYNADVVHFTDFIAENLDKLDLKNLNIKTTYHDPCRLGRYSGLYDNPRRILEHISDFVEMENVKENAICCGVSSWLNCNKESRQQREDRMKEALNTGAVYLVTSCPKCRVHLDCIYYDKDEEIKIKKIETLDIQEMVAWSLGIYDPFSEEVSYQIKPTEGQLPEVPELERDAKKYLSDELLDLAFRCTTCRKCTELCPSGHDTSRKMEGFRRELVKRDLGPEKHKGIVDNLKRTGNVFGEEQTVEEGGEDAEIIYFPGCVAKYRMGNLKDATTEIFKALGIKYKIPKDIVCCGSVLFRTGHDPSDLIAKNKEIFGEKPVVVSCAGCYSTFKHDYEGVNVQHISEFLSDKLDKLDLKDLKVKVTYHDPCHLGRGSGVYDAPRKVIEAVPGIEFVEFEHTKENSDCCGAGGGVKAAKPELANGLGVKRAAQAKALEVDIVLSSCPFCELNLKQNSDLNVMDVVECVLKSLKGDS